MTLIQCVCVFWIANVVLWFAVCIDDGNGRTICTDSPSCPYTRPVELRTGCESDPKSNLAPWAATYWMHQNYLDKLCGSLHQNKVISMYVF